jgi:type I restriction enzyme S subunit
MATSQDFVNWVCSNSLDHRYLKYILLAERSAFLRFASGTTHQTIYFPEVKAFHVCLPPLVEQRAIASVLGTLDDKIELNRQMNATLEAMAQALFKSWFVDFDPVRAKADGREGGLSDSIANLFPDSFDDAEIGDVPAGWIVRTIDDVAEVNAWTLKASDQLANIDYVEISEVMKGEVASIAQYERGSEPSRARRRLRHGDTVLSTVRPDRGAHFLCLHPPETLIASTGFATLSARDGNWAFLHAFLTLPEIGAELGRLADGGAYPAIRPEVLATLALPLPSQPELVAAFQSLTSPMYERAAQNRVESRTLAALRDTLLPKLISGELRVKHAESLIAKIA